MSPLTRKERQARTRSRLMDSAGKLFCRHGLERASIDEVAEDAGFTKGAFYANFKSKQELFLAMLDDHFEERVRQLDRVLATDEPVQVQAREAGRAFAESVGGSPEWTRLFFEFATHATRDEDFRQELLTRYRTLRRRIAELYHRRAREHGKELPLPAEQLAMMTMAMAKGMAVERMLDRDAVPDDLYGTMLAIFWGGVGAMDATHDPVRSGR